MDFALNECLHNTKIPIRYNSCEVDESLELNSFRVVSEHCELRTIRARNLTVKLGRAIKLSLNRRGSKAVRFGLQKVPALFCEKLKLNTKQRIQQATGEKSISRTPKNRNLEKQSVTGSAIRRNTVLCLLDSKDC
jgi:hypothetical protein